jgi:uncharacterized delta-60 repeat protein
MGKVNRIFVFVAIALMVSSSCYAEEWARTYGGAEWDYAHSIQETSDGGYIVAGESSSFTEGGDLDAWILKLNPDGSVAWQKTYGGNGSETASSIKETADGGYIVAGWTSSFGEGRADFWVLKLNPDTSVAWQKSYGGADWDYAYSIQEASGGGYIVAGYTYSLGLGGPDFWILKLNSDGSVAWQNNYGESSNEGLWSIDQTSDGGYIAGGWTSSFGAGVDDFWIIRLNSSGIVAWQKTYGGGSYDCARSIQETSDGGYIVAGYSYSFGAGQTDLLVLKLNFDGSIVWQKTYGGTDWEWANAIQETADGGYIVAGRTRSFGVGDYDFWILKLNSDGDVTWEKTYGGTESDEANAVQETADGGYIVAGRTRSFGAGDYDFWVLKLDAKGRISRCSAGSKSSATVSDSLAVVGNSDMVPQPSSAAPADTGVAPENTLAETALVCPHLHLAAVREKLSGKQGLFVYSTPLQLDGTTEPPVATDRSFGKSNRGSNIIAMTCVDTDGDGVDEIAVIRQRPGGRQRLEIYNPPETVGGDAGNPIASDLSFGDLNSDNNNIAMAAVDIDGDGTDEIAVVRQKQTGRQRLFIFNAPQGVEGQAGPAIASDSSFGHRDMGNNVIAITGIDIDADGVDEIAVIMQRASGRQRLEIYHAPQGVEGETGDPIATDLTFGDSTTDKNNIVIAGVDTNSDGIEEIAVVRQKTSGRQRLEIYNAPQTVDGDTGQPILSDLTFGTAGTDIYTKFISRMSF